MTTAALGLVRRQTLGFEDVQEMLIIVCVSV